MKTAPRIGTALAAVVVAGLAWWLLAPTQLGGSTGYAVVVGQSMEPEIERGDLVLVRQRGEYGVGNVVLYDNRELDRNVLHRIVAAEAGRFVLKGDANGFRDGYRPTSDDVIGEVATVVPGVGRFVELAKHPLNVALLVFAMVFVLLVGGRSVTRATRRRPRSLLPQPTAPQGRAVAHVAWVARPTLTGSLVALGLFVLVGAAAWARPAERAVTVSDALAHRGTFSYEATVPPSAVYPSGRAETGDAAFRQIVSAVDVAFTYALEGDAARDAAGTATLRAELSDGNGWSRALLLAPDKSFEGGTASVRGTLDLERVDEIMREVQEEAGVSLGTVLLTVVPTVRVEGHEAFAPRLELQYDHVALRLPAASKSRLAPRRTEAATTLVPTTMPGPLDLTTVQARYLALLGIVLSLALAGSAALVLGRSAGQGESGRIAARLGPRLLTVAQAVPDGRWVTDVDEVEALARVSDRYDRLILHSVVGGTDVYTVDDGFTVYRYVAGDAPTGRLSAVAGP